MGRKGEALGDVSLEILKETVDGYPKEQLRKQPHIILGSSFFKRLFLKLAWRAATSFIPQDTIDAMLARLKPSDNSDEMVLVDTFVSQAEYTFEYDLPDGQFRIEQGTDGPVYHCSEGDGRMYWTAYIDFLADLPIVLAGALAEEIYGQCAFSIKWLEDDRRTPLPREK